MNAFETEVLSRLPLSEALLWCWQWTLNSHALRDIFERYRGRSYGGVMTFETIVTMTSNALIEHGGS